MKILGNTITPDGKIIAGFVQSQCETNREEMILLRGYLVADYIYFNHGTCFKVKADKIRHGVRGPSSMTLEKITIEEYDTVERELGNYPFRRSVHAFVLLMWKPSFTSLEAQA
jgi:hypothetical protein